MFLRGKMRKAQTRKKGMPSIGLACPKTFYICLPSQD